MIKIAIVYDRINTKYGGAEKVLMALHQAFVDATFFTSVYDPQVAIWAKHLEIKTTFLQNIPWAKNHHRHFAPLMPLAFESLNLEGYDVVISVTSAEAIGVITSPKQLHLCYLLSPPRYLFSHQDYYLQNEPGLSHSLTKYPAKQLLAYLKSWYQVAAARPDYIIPISHFVATRCQEFFNRTTLPVIYPPVELPGSSIVEQSRSQPFDQPYFLCVSRLLHYKRLDLAITAANELKKHLIIIGQGPYQKKLKQIASSSKNQYVHFLNHIDQNEVSNYYQHCQALIMPGEEDFGITGLEANAHGKPAIIFQKSGIAEILGNHVHAIHLTSQTVEQVKKAMQDVETSTFEAKLLQQNSSNYDTNIFVNKFRNIVRDLWEKHSGHLD
ncbi:MAG: glycosyltransferase [Patescibacteria group bacterium]